MTIKRWAARADKNRSEIAQVFRDHGWIVYDLRQPVDLLCGKNNLTLLVEIKSDKKARLTQSQKDFMSTWLGGPVLTIRTKEDAISAAQMVI